MSRPLLGGEAEGFPGLVDHFAHLANAAGALDLAALGAEHVHGTRGPRLYGGPDLTLADAVAVADVHEGNPDMRTIRM